MSGYANNVRGTRHYRQGNFAEASRYFRMAAADKPHDADYLHNLASTMWKQGDVNGAEQLYRRALSVDPMHQPSYHSLSKMLKENNRPNEAQNLLSMWSETQPYIAEPKIEMAWLNRELGNEPAAEQNLRQALQIDPRNATALAHLGQVYQDQGRSGEALAMYQRSLFQDWNQPAVRGRLSNLNGAPAAMMPSYPVVAQPMYQWQPQPVIVRNPHTPTVTLMPPIPAGTTANSSSSIWVAPRNGAASGQPIQLGSPLTNADPAHADLRFSALPVVPAY